MKALVAFSGEVVEDDFPDKKFTEVSMNGGIRESELPERFNTEEYQVLIVAEKYQTGFDQPLLHTMYVDKRLDGVQFGGRDREEGRTPAQPAFFAGMGASRRGDRGRIVLEFHLNTIGQAAVSFDIFARRCGSYTALALPS